jgi:hypothetical protein
VFSWQIFPGRKKVFPAYAGRHFFLSARAHVRTLYPSRYAYSSAVGNMAGRASQSVPHRRHLSFALPQPHAAIMCHFASLLCAFHVEHTEIKVCSIMCERPSQCDRCVKRHRRRVVGCRIQRAFATHCTPTGYESDISPPIAARQQQRELRALLILGRNATVRRLAHVARRVAVVADAKSCAQPRGAASDRRLDHRLIDQKFMAPHDSASLIFEVASRVVFMATTAL